MLCGCGSAFTPELATSDAMPAPSEAGYATDGTSDTGKPGATSDASDSSSQVTDGGSASVPDASDTRDARDAECPDVGCACQTITPGFGCPPDGFYYLCGSQCCNWSGCP